MIYVLISQLGKFLAKSSFTFTAAKIQEKSDNTWYYFIKY